MRAVFVKSLVLAALASASSAHAQQPPAPSLIINRRSGMCLEPPDGQRTIGAVVRQYRCTDPLYQRWTFTPGGKDRHSIVNLDSGLCLDVAGDPSAEGASIVQQVCDGRRRQRWRLQWKADMWRLVSDVGLCVEVDGDPIGEGAALVQRACRKGVAQRWTLSSGPVAALLSDEIPLNMIPVAASTLRNGKILAWSSTKPLGSDGGQAQTVTALFDPATGVSSLATITNTAHDMFCPGVATLSDGRILVNGGGSGGRTSIYNPKTDRWTVGAEMNVPRGYNSDTVLTNGDVLTIGGSWNGGYGGKIGEVWSRTGGWRSLPNVAGEALSDIDETAGIYRADNHMWLFGTSDGGAFHAGPSREMHWVSTVGDGAVTSAGPRGDDGYAMNGNVVMFDANRLLKLGGAPSYEEAYSSPNAYVIDFSQGPSKPVTVERQKPMAFPRSFANAVALPNGQVVVVGGVVYPITFSDYGSILIPEIWTPETGAFSRLSSVMAIPRNYHSVATLMLDGRVFIGGGGLCNGCDTNHPNANILTPPYLLNPDGTPADRPGIVRAPTSMRPGDTLTVETDRAVASFSMVRMSAVTHSINNDQRRIPVSIESVDGQTYRLITSADRSVMIPGDWMLFAITDTKTPSVAKIVRVR